MTPLDPSAERLLRDLAPQLLGMLLRRFGSFSDAEDAVQEALIAAAAQWPQEGVPEHPRAWLMRVAARRMSDRFRSDLSRREREASAVRDFSYLAPAADAESAADRDDALNVLFMCCHPALTRSSAIALTLRAVGGLTTAEIAKAFFVPEATMAQRISRAKQSIKASGIPFRAPEGRERGELLRSVLHVLYLIFNEGYASSDGLALVRSDLSSEAIRLTRTLYELLPDDGDVMGLLALMLLTDARRAARTRPDGALIPLSEQDRSLWDRVKIAEGVALVTAALSKARAGAYQIQAAIAAVHNEALSAEETDWPQICALYELLMRISDNPMVALNHAVAVAMTDGPTAGLDLLAGLEADGRVGDHHRLAAVRAHLLEMSGDYAGAIEYYRIAAGRTASTPERNYLLTRAARLR